MAIYQVEQYEIHVTSYQVEANDQAEAIQKIFEGDGDIINTKYIETDETRGMSTGNLTIEEAKQLDAYKIVPGIRSVREK